MGMSSSQARLLTLTGRMHSIEQRAQRIQAEKLRLANESDRVYDDYLLALDETKLVAKVLSENGTTTDIPFTAGLVYTYNGLMGQYALKSKDDKALIPENISNNYKSTNTLSDFLKAYGMNTTYTYTVHHEDPNPAYETKYTQWENDYNNWANWKADHDKWLEEKAKYDIDYANWLTKDPNDVRNDQTQIWWTESTYNLGQSFYEAARSTKESNPQNNCYDHAINNNVPGCYLDILSMIIEYDGSNIKVNKNFTTTLGGTTTLNDGTDGWCSNHTKTLSNGKTNHETFAEVSDQLDAGIIPDITGETCDISASSTEYEKLVSMWNVDGTVKTMKQWAIDLNYIGQKTLGSTNVDGYPGNAAFCQTIIKFQAKLENSLLLTIDETKFNTAVTTWNNAEPTLRSEPTLNGSTSPAEPKVEDYVGTISPTVGRDENKTVTTFTDKDLAQWYINLWYKMEGQDETPLILETIVHDDTTGTDTTIYSITNQTKSTTTFSTNAKTGAEENENYIIIPTDKLEDPTWLKNSILEGYVIIQQFDKLEGKFSDTSVSITTKIHEVPDETNLKKAEAQYEADMKRINAKDAKYDRELAVVDNERNAIKTEIDTLKNVAKDNVDRTFKLFS